MTLSSLLSIYWMPSLIKSHLNFLFTYFTAKGEIILCLHTKLKCFTSNLILEIEITQQQRKADF